MNKYQEALDILNEQLDYLCFNLKANYPYTIEMIEKVQSCFQDLILEHFILNDALDKACEELHDTQMSEAGIDEELHGFYPNFKNADEWKEWLLKEVQEDEK